MHRFFVLLLSAIGIAGVVPSAANSQWVMTSAPQGNSLSGPTTALFVSGSNLIQGGAFELTYYTFYGDGALWFESSSPGGDFLDGSTSAMTDVGGIVYGGGAGLWLSTNNGIYWTNLRPSGWPTGDEFISLLFRQSKLFGGNLGGLYVSSDTGVTWTSSLTGSGRVRALSANGKYLFAGTSNAGVNRSSDNGTHWEQTSTGLIDTNVIALCANDSAIYAGTNNKGLFRSTDNGIGWVHEDISSSADQIECIGTLGENVFVGSNSGVYLSTDNGSTWNFIGNGLPNDPVMALSVYDTSLFVAVWEDGVYRRSLSDLLSSADVNVSQGTQVSADIYPNPAHDIATIRFRMVQAGSVSVSMMNALGEEIAQVFSGWMSAGEHLLEWQPSDASNATYFCCIREDGASLFTVPIKLVH